MSTTSDAKSIDPKQTRIEKLKLRLLRKRRVDPASGCWIWTGTRDRTGGGVIWVDGVRVGVRRLAWAHWRGTALPRAISPSCGDSACFNPDHLEPHKRSTGIWLPFSAFSVEADSRGQPRTHCKNNHPLTPENVYTDRHGWRHCRLCMAQWKAASKKRNRPAKEE
jgi:hypothetical protein